MNYPDYSRACELGVRRLTNTKAITFAQRVKIIDACLAARSFEELEPWIQDLLRPDFEAMEEYLRQPAPPKRSIPAVGRHTLKPSKFVDLMGGSMTRPPHETQLGPDGRFSLCSQPPPGPPRSNPPLPPTPGTPPPATPTPSDAPPDTKSLDPTTFETKAAPGLRIEPYDPDAIDGDGDGIVQEGTAWERPAGTRLLSAAGEAIERGLTSAMRPQGLRVVDSDGNDISYKPRYGEGLPEQTIREPEKPTSKLGELGFPSLREQGHSPIIDLMAPKPPEPVKEPKPEKAPAVAKTTQDLAPVEAIPDLPWTVGIDGVDDPDLYHGREKRADAELDRAGWHITEMFSNARELLRWVVHGRTSKQEGFTDEQEANLARVEAAIQLLVDDLSGRGIGNAEEAFEALVLSDLAHLITDAGDGELLINTSAVDAVNVLESGHYYSQFVTGTSSVGSADLAFRRDIEQRFGVPLDAPDELRPVYGHVALPGDDTPYAERSAADSYGQITFILKDGLTDRTTFSIGDSYNAVYGMSIADVDDATNHALVAAAADPQIVSHTHVRRLDAELERLGVDESTRRLATQMLAHHFGLLGDEPTPRRDFDPDKRLPDDQFSYIEHQLHGGVSLDDIAAIHIPPNVPMRTDYPFHSEYAEQRIAENAAKDRLRKLAKERGITILEDPLARPDVTRARTGEVASAAVLEKLGGTPGGPLPYSPGHLPPDHRIPEQLGSSPSNVSARRSTMLYRFLEDSVGAIVGDDDGLSFEIRKRLTTDDVERHLVADIEKYRTAPTLLSTDADSVLGFFADESYLPASGIDGLEGLGAHRAQYELEGLGVPLDLPFERRPVYGHIDTRLEGDDVRALPGADYGPIHIVLKDSLKQRTTLTVGDSLIGQTVGIPAYETPTTSTATLAMDDETYTRLINEELVRAVRDTITHIEGFWSSEPGGASGRDRERIDKMKAWLETHATPQEGEGTVAAARLFDTTYLEAQIHGGVSIDDVAEIILPAGDDPQLKAIRSAAKDRGIRIVEEAAARRVTSAEELASKTYFQARAALSKGTPDVADVPTFVASTYSTAQLDDYIHFHNGELVVLEEKLAADVAAAEETVRNLTAELEANKGSGFGFARWGQLQDASGLILSRDAIQAKVRARILQRERRIAEGRPLEADYERLRNEYGLVDLPDPVAWPPSEADFAYPLDASASPITSAGRATRTKAQAGAAAADLIHLASTDWDLMGSVTLPDGTSLSHADLLRIAFLDIDVSGSSDEMRRLLADALATQTSDELRGKSAERILESALWHLERDVDHIREGRPVINVDDDVIVSGLFENGRYWSQFVTGSSNGMLATDWRAEAELQFAGIPDDLEPELRPVYGHIVHSTSDVDRAEQYGNMALILRPDSIADRTTFTIDDSLKAHVLDPVDGTGMLGALPLVPSEDELGDDLLRLLPGGVAQMNHDGTYWFEPGNQYYLDQGMADLIREKLEDLGIFRMEDYPKSILDRLLRHETPMPDRSKSWETYLEVQIHGGVALHDIESIYVDRNEWLRMDPITRAALMRRAEEYGIDIVHTIPQRP